MSSVSCSVTFTDASYSWFTLIATKNVLLSLQRKLFEPNYHVFRSVVYRFSIEDNYSGVIIV